MTNRISLMPESTSSYFNLNNFLPVINLSEPSSSFNQFQKLRFSTFTQLFANNTSVNNYSPNYFGTGADGDFTATSSLNFEVSDYGDPVVKHFKNFTINNGATVSTSLPSRGLIIYVTGDCTIDGTLTMTAKGTGPGNLIELRNEIDTLKSTLSYYKFGASTYTKNTFQSSSVWNDVSKINIFAERLAAGAPRTSTSLTQGGRSIGIAGSAGIYTAGGGGGGVRANVATTNLTFTCTTGAGGSGSFFCGGGGSGCAAGSTGAVATDNALFEIASNGLIVTTGGGGAGNPVGPGLNSGQFGVGGLLILIVKKNINIGLTGTISSNGSQGGLAGGGGSGGGRIVILYGGTLTNNGSITANGGDGGGGFAAGPGGTGGAGAITIQQVAI